MRSEASIRERVRGLLTEELDRRLEDRVQRLPHCCVHNHRQPLDNRKQVEGEPNEAYNRITDNRSLPVVQTIGLCMLGAESPEDWPGDICEDPIDAKRCPDFKLRQDKTEILEEFREELATPGWLLENMPEAASLCWVLDEMETQTPKLPWWKRVLVALSRTKVEPITKVTDPVGLLPAPEEKASEGVHDSEAPS